MHGDFCEVFESVDVVFGALVAVDVVVLVADDGVIVDVPFAECSSECRSGWMM